VPVVTSDSVVAADGGVYARAGIKSWIEECLQGTCATALAHRAEGSTASFSYIAVGWVMLTYGCMWMRIDVCGRGRRDGVSSDWTCDEQHRPTARVHSGRVRRHRPRSGISMGQEEGSHCLVYSHRSRLKCDF
jgi:hypothetical protein